MTNGNDEAFRHGAENGYCPGLTKREYFAAMAMQGILSCGNDDGGPVYCGATPQPDWDCTIFARMVGRDAVKYADALIETLNKKEEKSDE